MVQLPPATIHRLETETNIWFASVRADRRPHLVPLWFVWADARVYLCIAAGSVKMRNLLGNAAVSLALEDGARPVALEGLATVCDRPWPAVVVDGFQRKYDWLITADSLYDTLIAVTLNRALMVSDA